MNHWLILLLTIVAMWAIVLVFMWWWTTEKWDWASAELKPPRTVPQETEGRPLSWAEAEELKWKGRVADGLNDLTLQQLPSLEQRVTALEEGQEDLERGAHSLILTHIKAWHSPSPPPDLTPGPTASATTPTSLKDVKVHMEKTQAPTT